MTRITVSGPRELRAETLLPASKSISNRALVCAALAARCGGRRQSVSGRDTFDSVDKVGIGQENMPIQMPDNVSDCDDTRVMLRALAGLTSRQAPHEQIGSQAPYERAALQTPHGESTHVIDVMAAGTAMRFLTAYLSVTEGEHLITGTERMRQRPIRVLVDALRRLGAEIEYVENEGFPPLRIRGRRLKGGELHLKGDVSSQYISALMMIAPMLERGLHLTLEGGVVSRPYIDMTLRVMADYGAVARWTGERTLVVESGYRARNPYYYIENDWSASSYWYAMVALSPDPAAEVRLPGLFPDSVQGDSAVRDLFAPLGVATEFVEDGAVIRKASRPFILPTCLEIDLLRQPDLAQTMVVTCCILGVRFRFTGLQSLRIKETDRIAALETELLKWGYELHDSEADGTVALEWAGERTAPTASTNTQAPSCSCNPPLPPIDTYEDHRMAMAFAPACLVRGEVTINNPQVVSKSYPLFWEALGAAGFAVNL